PDYVINAGGVINVVDELHGYNRERAMKKVETIYDSLQKVFDIARRDNIPTYKAADRMAEERIESVRQSRGQFLPKEHHVLRRREMSKHEIKNDAIDKGVTQANGKRI